MLNLTPRQQISVGLALTLLMLLTRSHHWASIHSLPDASWAIFSCWACTCGRCGWCPR